MLYVKNVKQQCVFAQFQPNSATQKKMTRFKSQVTVEYMLPLDTRRFVSSSLAEIVQETESLHIEAALF